MVVDADTPDVRGMGLERQVFLLRDVLQDAERLGHHLRTYVVPRENGKLECRH